MAKKNVVLPTYFLSFTATKNFNKKNVEIALQKNITNIK